MSVEFRLRGNDLEPERWESLARETAEGLEIGLYQAPRFSVGDTPAAQLLGEGSVRGVLLTLEEPGVMNLRLNILSSRADWRLAYELLSRAMKTGGGELVREDGLAMEPADLTLEAADEASDSGYRSGLAILFSMEREVATLPVTPYFEIPFGPEVVVTNAEGELDVAATQAGLAAVVERYGQAVASQTVVLKNGLRVATWSLEPTIVERVDVLLLPTDASWKETLRVPFGVVSEALGDRIVACSQETLYLPAIDPDAEPGLLDAWRAASLPEAELAGDEPPERSLDEALRLIVSFAMAQLAQGQELQDMVAAAREEFPLDDTLVEASIVGVVTMFHAVAETGGHAFLSDPEPLRKRLAGAIPEGLAEPLVVAFMQVCGELARNMDHAEK